MFPTFDRLLLLGLLPGMIRSHDPHRRHPRSGAALASPSSPSSRHHRAATAADPASMTAPRWPGSSTNCAPASPWRLLPARQLGCGSPVTCWRRLRDCSAPAYGSSSTTCCWMRSAATASSTGLAPASTAWVYAPSGGRADRPEPDRPWQARVQVPPADRPPRHPPCRRPVGANTHDSMLLEPVVDAVPPVKARVAVPVDPASGLPSSTVTRACATRRCVTGWGERTHRWAVAAAWLKLRAALAGRRQAGWEQP